MHPETSLSQQRSPPFQISVPFSRAHVSTAHACRARCLAHVGSICTACVRVQQSPICHHPFPFELVIYALFLVSCLLTNHPETSLRQQRSTPVQMSDVFSRGHDPHHSLPAEPGAQHMLDPSSMSVVWFACRGRCCLSCSLVPQTQRSDRYQRQLSQEPSYHRVLKAHCGEAVNPWWRSIQAIVADHVPRDWPDTSWSPRVRSVPVLRFGFECGELNDAKSGVPVVPLVLISFCWPSMLPVSGHVTCDASPA